MLEADAIIKQIYASEVDYLEIRKRADTLKLMPVRTPAQGYELGDYQKKLAHDKEVITKWMARLKVLGVSKVAVSGAVRTNALTELKQSVVSYKATLLVQADMDVKELDNCNIQIALIDEVIAKPKVVFEWLQ